MQKLSICIVLVVFGGLFAYISLQVYDSLRGPTITILSHEPHQVVASTVTLTGRVEQSVLLTVNDKKIIPSSDGIFEHFMILPAGYSIVSVYAEDRYGRNVTTLLPLYIQPYESSKKENEQDNGDGEER